MSAPGGVARNIAAETEHRNTQAARLRAVLRDGQWHKAPELVAVAGHRFGASIYRVRRGEDGGRPWEIQRVRMTASGSRWVYRFVRELDRAHVMKPESLVAQLRKQLAAYRIRMKEHGVPIPRRVKGGGA